LDFSEDTKKEGSDEREEDLEKRDILSLLCLPLPHYPFY
jgi:hypothetical protein